MSDVINAHDLGVAGGYIIEAAMQGDIDQLKAENARLREYVTKLEAANLDVTARLTDYIGQYDPTDAFVAEVKAENAKLREELADAPKCETCEAMLDCDECLRADGSHKERRRLSAENAKLRELVRWMYDRMDESCAVQYPYAPAPISYDRLMQARARARELGVEVTS